MTPADALQMTRNQVNENGQAVAIRRYTGPAGPNRAHDDYPTRAFVRNYGSKELIGSIIQGDQVAITLIDTLGGVLPVTTNDKLVVSGKEYAIKNPMKRVVGGVLIALELQCSG
ncbi:hypothetical protein V1281_002587 [Nitrobacteraceae bacterium AZCC 2161]